jgi:phenylacetate-CoA ligase
VKVIINAVSLKSGGGARYIAELLRELRSLKLPHEFLVFLPAGLRAIDEISTANIRVQVLPKMSWWRRLWWDQVSVRRILKRECANVLFSSANFGMLFCPVGQLLLVQTVIYSSSLYRSFMKTHSLRERMSFVLRRWLFHLSIRNADIVMVPSQAALRDVTTELGGTDPRFVINPYGIRNPESNNGRSSSPGGQAENGGTVRLGFVSVYYEHKNLLTLLKSMPLLNISGDGDQPQFILSTTVDPGKGNCVSSHLRREELRLTSLPEVKRWIRFTGLLNENETEALYRDLDIFVFPSVVESFGFPLLEAMAYALPIVASDTPVNREICGDAARYFSPFDAEALASEIRQLAVDEQLRHHLASVGRKRATQFTWSDHIRRILQSAKTISRVAKARVAVGQNPTPFFDLWYSLYERLPTWGQNVATSAYGAVITHRRFGGSYRATLSQAVSRDEWKREELLQWQARRIKALVEHTLSTVPYYQRIARERHLSPNDFSTVKDLARLPLITKRDVLANAAEFVSSTLAERQTTTLTTSGSTGERLRLIVDRASQQEQWAVWWRYRMKLGLTSDVWCACFAGRVIIPATVVDPPFWRINYPAKQVLYSAYHMSQNALPHYIADMRTRNLQWVHGYPSILTVLARYILQHGITLKMKWVTVGAESLSSSQKSLIEAAFGCRCFQHYACIEGVANFSECEAGILHADEDICALDLIPTDDPHYFMITGTNLTNFAMPLINYDTEDLCTGPLERCVCGRDGICISKIKGRRNDTILLKDGRPLGTLDEAFELVPNLCQAQIIQSKPGHIVVRIVAGPRWADDDEQTLLRAFHWRVGSLLDVDIQYSNELERTSSGKVRMVISHCAADL